MWWPGASSPGASGDNVGAMQGHLPQWEVDAQPVDSSSTESEDCSLCGFHGIQATVCRYCKTRRCETCYERGDRCLCYNEGRVYFTSPRTSFHSEHCPTPPLPGTPTPADEPQPRTDYLAPPPAGRSGGFATEVPEMMLGEEAAWAFIPPKPTRPTPRWE